MRAGGCLYWIHTHDGSGVIHIEAPDIAPPQGGPFTLGMFFDIWGQPLERNNVGGLAGPVAAYVNGTKYDGDLHAIPLGAHQQIVLVIGTPSMRAARTSRTQASTTRFLPEIAPRSLSWTSTMRSWDLSRASSMG